MYICIKRERVSLGAISLLTSSFNFGAIDPTILIIGQSYIRFFSEMVRGMSEKARNDQSEFVLAKR